MERAITWTGKIASFLSPHVIDCARFIFYSGQLHGDVPKYNVYIYVNYSLGRVTIKEETSEERPKQLPRLFELYFRTTTALHSETPSRSFAEHLYRRKPPTLLHFDESCGLSIYRFGTDIDSLPGRLGYLDNMDMFGTSCYSSGIHSF